MIYGTPLLLSSNMPVPVSFSLTQTCGQGFPEGFDQLFEDLKTNDIKKNKKKLLYQLIKNLCEIQAQSTTETIKYKKITNELEENIKQLQSQFNNLQT